MSIRDRFDLWRLRRLASRVERGRELERLRSFERGLEESAEFNRLSARIAAWERDRAAARSAEEAA